MASNFSTYERSYRRTFSAGTSSDGDAEVETTVVQQRRKSENISDLLSLEEIVTCSIHLGIMEDPRKLQCQHAFCSECLKGLPVIHGSLRCPICRAMEPCSDVASLPHALVERQLIDVVMQKRITTCTLSTAKEYSLSKEGKEELVKHLMKELKQSSSGLFRFDEVVEVATNHIDKSHNCDQVMQTSTSSSTYDMMDIETIRENMLKHSCYEDVKHCFKKFGRHHGLKKHSRTEIDFTTFDIHVIDEHADCYEIVYVDSFTNRFFVYSTNQTRSFFIHLDGIIIKPVYIKILHDDIFVTALITDDGSTFSLFLQSNLYGKVIRKSERYQNLQQRLPSQMLCGFDVDERNEKYFVCAPHSNSIQVYNTSLVDSRQRYEFDNNKPEFVTFFRHQNQIWVSCPEDRRILIAEVDTGVFMMFRTDQINEAIPKMIFSTDNERIIFLDSRSNRFIWIKRRGDYILTQKLHFRSINEDQPIRAFQVLPSSQIVIGTVNDFHVYQPVKLKSKLKLSLTSCTIL